MTRHVLIFKEDAMKHNFRMRRLCFFSYKKYSISEHKGNTIHAAY